MPFITYLKDVLRKHVQPKSRLIEWNRQPAVTRIERPTSLLSARSVGWRAKQGFVLARVRIKKGKRKRPLPRKARKPKSMGVYFTPGKSKQWMAEERAQKKFPNLEVLNSYKAGETGTHIYYEVVLVDPHHPAVRADKRISWILNDRKRVYRGRTSAARKSRGLGRGFGYEKRK